MTIQHMDNFSMYGTNKALLLNGVYAEATQAFETFGLAADPDGSGGITPYFQCNNATMPLLRFVLSSAQSICGWCVRLWLDFLPDADNHVPQVMSWRNAGNGEMAHLQVETTGRLTWTDGVTTITTTNPVVSANGWYHIEAKYTTSGTGAIEIRVEGLQVISQVGLGYAGHSAVYQVSSYYSGTNFSPSLIMRLKDYVIWDGAGTLNNDFLGAVIVYGLLPLSDVALNWTPVGAADGFSILDNSPPDDAKYIQAPNPPPAAYKCTLSDLPPDVTSVKAIMSMVRAAKTDGGDANLQAGVISDPSGVPATVLGADRPITVTMTYWRDVFETDPKTSAAWLPAAVNAAQLQLNRTS
jgi:hypothetical protein